MPLEDLDLQNSTKKNLTQKWFYKNGIVLFSFGILVALVLAIPFSNLNELIDENPFFLYPIVVGIIPLFLSAVYNFFEKNIKEPLKNNWGKIHFFLTIIPLYFALTIGLIFFHHLYMNGMSPMFSLYSPVSISWLMFVVGQIFFLANIFQSLKLSFYKNANYHPTHYFFSFATFLFFVKAIFSYLFYQRNFGWDLQLHDTYYVFSYFHIDRLIVVSFLIFSGLYYFLNRRLQKPLNPFLSKLHFFLMVISVLYFLMLFNSYGGSVRRYYSSEEGMLLYYNFIQNQYLIAIGVFLLAQVLFLVNIISSFFSKKQN